MCVCTRGPLSPPPPLPGVAQIGEDDIEIDIDRVDPATFWVVDKFVKECMGSNGDKKRRATGEAGGGAAGAGAGAGSAGAGAPTGAPHKKIRQ